MKVVGNEFGEWYVIDTDNGKRISPVCQTENQAWHWFDKLVQGYP